MFDDPTKKDWRDDIEAIREESRMAGGIREIETLLGIIDKQREALQLGITMRKKQNVYFKNRTKENLNASIQIEAEFDKVAAQILAQVSEAPK